MSLETEENTRVYIFYSVLNIHLNYFREVYVSRLCDKASISQLVQWSSDYLLTKGLQRRRKELPSFSPALRDVLRMQTYVFMDAQGASWQTILWISRELRGEGTVGQECWIYNWTVAAAVWKRSWRHWKSGKAPPLHPSLVCWIIMVKRKLMRVPSNFMGANRYSHWKRCKEKFSHNLGTCEPEEVPQF